MHWSLLSVMAGGAIGSGLRFMVGLAVPMSAGRFPITTLAINVVGSFVLGVVSAMAARTTVLNRELTLFLGAGLCGGFTTFSTFSVELISMWELDRVWPMLAYALASLVGGFLAALLGISVVSSLTR
ncbi:MAG: fluoride efflux transporter CrcB [Bacteroidetes bacterium]|nr:fluoride efflux transporter CrcB [Bacteroidota bacterium]